MLTGHSPRVLVFLGATSLLVGCAQPGPILSGRTTFGTLKTSLSHLEFENQQLRTKVSQLVIDPIARLIDDQLPSETTSK